MAQIMYADTDSISKANERERLRSRKEPYLDRGSRAFVDIADLRILKTGYPRTLACIAAVGLVVLISHRIPP